MMQLRQERYKYLNRILLVLFLIGSPILAQNELIDEIVGVVGDKIILHSDVEVQYHQAVTQGAPSDDLKCSILDQMLLEKLLLNQAEIDSVTVSEDEVENELNNRFRYYINLLGSEAEFERYFQKTVLEFKQDFRPEIKDLLIAQRMQGDIVNNIAVSPREVREFYSSIPKDSIPYFNSEVELAQIVMLPKVSDEAKKATYEKLVEIRTQIITGEKTFEELAKKHSQDLGSGANGGSLGWASRGDFVPEFESTAFKLQREEISEIVESDFGFHVIQLVERRGNRINCKHILLKPDIFDEDTDIAEQLIDSVRVQIETGEITFGDAVQEYSEDESSKSQNGFMINPQSGSTVFEMTQVDPEIYFAIESLQKGDVSNVHKIILPTGEKAFRLIKILERTKPHLANVSDDFARLKAMVETQKQEEALLNWVTKNSRNTYIQISDSYDDCGQMGKWRVQ